MLRDVDCGKPAAALAAVGGLLLAAASGCCQVLTCYPTDGASTGCGRPHRAAAVRVCPPAGRWGGRHARVDEMMLGGAPPIQPPHSRFHPVPTQPVFAPRSVAPIAFRAQPGYLGTRGLALPGDVAGSSNRSSSPPAAIEAPDVEMPDYATPDVPPPDDVGKENKPIPKVADVEMRPPVDAPRSPDAAPPKLEGPVQTDPAISRRPVWRPRR